LIIEYIKNNVEEFLISIRSDDYLNNENIGNFFLKLYYYMKKRVFIELYKKVKNCCLSYLEISNADILFNASIRFTIENSIYKH